MLENSCAVGFPVEYFDSLASYHHPISRLFCRYLLTLSLTMTQQQNRLAGENNSFICLWYEMKCRKESTELCCVYTYFADFITIIKWTLLTFTIFNLGEDFYYCVYPLCNQVNSMSETCFQETMCCYVFIEFRRD